MTEAAEIPPSPPQEAFALTSSRHAGELVLVFDEARGVTLLEGDVDGDGAADLKVELDGRHDHFAGLVM